MAELVVCQFVSAPDIDTNLDRTEAFLRDLNVTQDTLVVLPECFACFGAGDKRLLDIAQSAEQETIQSRLSKLAATYKVWLVTGTIPLKSDVEGKFTASSLLIDDSGKVVAEYQKIHLFDVQVEDNTGQYSESRYTEAGSDLVVVDTPFGRLGMAVCYDVRFAGMFQAMGQLDVLVLPSAFTQRTGEAHWHSLLRARAIEKQCYLLAANQGGVHANGRQTYGHSCIISPWGDILAEHKQGEGMIQAPMDSQLLETLRRNMPVHQHNKFRSYLV